MQQQRSTPAGVKAFRSWLQSTGRGIADVGRAIDDPRGGQLQKWSSGARPSLPLALKVKLAEHTGIRFSRLLTPQERELIADIRRLLVRDGGLPA